MILYYSYINEFSVEDLKRMVGNERLEQSLRYKMEADVKRSLLAGALLEYAADDLKWDIRRPLKPVIDNYKKPHLYDNSNNELHYSLSHSGDMVVCAVACNSVGVDIETIGDYRQGIVNRFFSLHERNLVYDKNSFFNIWSLKESYMKITGLGMALAMDCFYVKPDNADKTKYTYGVEDGNVSDDIVSDRLKINDRITGRIINLRDGYSAAVCGIDWNGIYEIRKVEKM